MRFTPPKKTRRELYVWRVLVEMKMPVFYCACGHRSVIEDLCDGK